MTNEEKYRALIEAVIDLLNAKKKYNQSKSITDLEAYRQSLQRIQRFIDDNESWHSNLQSKQPTARHDSTQWMTLPRQSAS